MAAEIIVQPEELWEYITDWGDGFDELYEIAKDDSRGISVYVFCDTTTGMINIAVEENGEEVWCEEIIGALDAESTCREIYENYFNDEESFVAQQGAIESRENELQDAMYDFLVNACEQGIDDFDIVEDCLDHILEYLYRKHNISVYRPMILEDENGEDFFEEHPYECMEFDDEDNPLYK